MTHLPLPQPTSYAQIVAAVPPGVPHGAKAPATPDALHCPDSAGSALPSLLPSPEHVPLRPAQG